MTNAMSFSSTGRYLGFAQWGGSAPALHLPEGEMKSGFPLRAPALTSLATDPSGSSLYVTRFDGNVTEHNTSNGKDVGELELGDTVQKQAVGDRYYFAAVSNYIGEPEHNMRVLERESGRQAAIRRIDSSRVFDVSHDGKLVVMIDEEKMFASCSWIGEPERFYCKYNLPKSVFADPEIILDAEVLGNGPEVFLVIRKASDSKRQEVIFNTLDGSVRELPGACNKVDENNELWVAAGWSEDGTVLARVVREGYGTEIGFWEASTCQQLNVIELDEPICIYGPKVRKVKISQDNAWAYVDRCRKGEAYLVPVGSEHVPTKLVVDRFAWGSPVFEEDGEQAAGYIAFVSKEGSLACLAIAIGDPMRLKIWLVLLGSVLGLLAGIFVFLKNSRQRRKLVQSMIIHTPEGGP